MALTKLVNSKLVTLDVSF